QPAPRRRAQARSHPRAAAWSRGARMHSLGLEEIARVGEAGRNVFMAEAWIVPENLRFGPAVGHQSDDEFNGQTRSPYNRLPRQNGRIEDNSLARAHGLAPQRLIPPPEIRGLVAIIPETPKMPEGLPQSAE